MWVLISSRSISLIFVKLGEQFSIQAGFYLMSIFIVSLSHVTLLRLVVVKMCHWKWGILNQTDCPYFIIILWLQGGFWVRIWTMKFCSISLRLSVCCWRDLRFSCLGNIKKSQKTQSATDPYFTKTWLMTHWLIKKTPCQRFPIVPWGRGPLA